MHNLRQQRTIGDTVCVEGFGYWSGKDVRVAFQPASANTGIVFVRGDVPGQPRIRCTVDHRIETPRRTTLAANDTSVEMIEHIMATLAGMRIDNCEVWVDSSEMPGCDGSSLPFVEALESVEVVEQDAARATLTVTEVTRVGDEDSWVEARPSRESGFSLKYRLDYGSEHPIGRQSISLAVTEDSFKTELAPARTFIMQEEAEWLRKQGLGTRVDCRDLLVFNDTGPIDNALRFEDECVRHKALDLVGDLALAGCDLDCHVVAYRSGHRLNAELVRRLLTEGQVVDYHSRKTA